jgi:hypothetical protein
MDLPQYAFVPGESNGQRLARIVKDFVGCSLSSGKDRLKALVCRGVETDWNAESVVRISTNCATTALGVLAAGCGDVDTARGVHPLLATPYKIGMAVAWLQKIGTDLGAWVPWKKGDPIPVGALCWYDGGGNNVHVEWKTAEPDEHCGGGRPNNAISLGTSDMSTNAGRPLVRYMNPDVIPLPVAAIPDEPQPVS